MIKNRYNIFDKSSLTGEKMFDFDAIKSANKKAVVNIEKQSDNYEKLYGDAMEHLCKAQETNDIDMLKSSAELFMKVIEIKSSNPEPYFYTALVFYLVGNNELALKYLKVVQAINPGFPDLNKFMKEVMK